MRTKDRSRNATTMQRVYYNTEVNGLDKPHNEEYNTVSPGAIVDIFNRDSISKNPEWARRKTNYSGFVPPTQYSHNSVRFSPYHGYYSAYDPAYYMQLSGNISGGISTSFQSFSLPDASADRDRSIIKALKTLKNQDIDLSVAFAERGQVSNMFLKTTTAIASCIRNIKKGNLPQAARELFVNPKKWMKVIPPPSKAEVHKHYLAMKYGWQPLKADLYGAAKALAERDSKENRYRLFVKGSSKSSSIQYEEVDANVGMRNFYRRNARAYTRLDYQLPDSAALMQASSLGLINPFSTSWELLPFSFVADWFIPIGDLLTCLDAAAPYAFLGGCTTSVQECDAISCLMTKAPIAVNGFSKRYQHASTREVYSVSPLPSRPRYNSKKNNTHVAEGLSLIAQAVA